MNVFIFSLFTIFYVESTTTTLLAKEALNLKDAIYTYLEDDNTTACSLCDAYCPNSDSKDNSRVPCVDNSQCPSNKACLIGFCEDPCPFFGCPEKTECTTFNHSATCISAHSCNMHEDCPSDKTCLNKRCEDLCSSYKCGGDLSCKIFDPNIYCVHKRRYHPETSKKMNFNQAMDFCYRRGLRLATFNTEDEYYQLVETLKKIKPENMDAEQSPWYYGFLIGGSDEKTRDKWMWMSSGKPLTYTKWDFIQPDHRIRNNDTEHCLELQPAYNYHMNDVSCYLASNFVCEDFTMA